jgi:hypothetical protein
VSSTKSRFTLAPRVVLAVYGLLGACAAVPTLLYTSTATAAPSGGQEEGRTRFVRGLELYREGNFHAALAEFRAANEAAPSTRIQYNLGQTFFQLKAYAEALNAFEAFLSEGRAKIPEDQLKAVEADIALLRQRVHELSIVVTPANLKVQLTVDDEERTLVSGSIRVSAGRRKLTVTATGYQTETRLLDLAGSIKSELNIELKPLASSASNAPPPVLIERMPAPPTSRNRTPFYVGVGVTATLGAGTAVFALLAASKHSAWQQAAAVPNPNKSELDSLRSSTRTFALVGDVLGGATLVAGVTSLVLLATGRRESTAAASSTARVTVQPAFGLREFALRGSF